MASRLPGQTEKLVKVFAQPVRPVRSQVDTSHCAQNHQGVLYRQIRDRRLPRLAGSDRLVPLRQWYYEFAACSRVANLEPSIQSSM